MNLVNTQIHKFEIACYEGYEQLAFSPPKKLFSDPSEVHQEVPFFDLIQALGARIPRGD